MENIISFRSQNFANNLAALMDKNNETPLELSERIHECIPNNHGMAKRRCSN